MPDLVLASASATRRHMLSAAGLAVEAAPVRIDEEALRTALTSDGASPRDIADALAEMKACKCAARQSGLVLGCDQVLEFDGVAWGKPTDRAAARQHLRILRGKTHTLWSAAVLYDGPRPVWRHVAEARLTMRVFSDAYLDAYLDRHWPAISDSVGCYRIEEEGVRLFSAVTGDHFTILGLPLIPLLTYLADRGAIAT